MYGLVVWGQKGWDDDYLVRIESPRLTSSLAIAEIVAEVFMPSQAPIPIFYYIRLPVHRSNTVPKCLTASR